MQHQNFYFIRMINLKCINLKQYPDLNTNFNIGLCRAAGLLDSQLVVDKDQKAPVLHVMQKGK